MQCETSCVLIQQITSSGRIYKQQAATCIIQQHWTTSADTYHHYSATVNSIQHQLASHCNCGQLVTSQCNVPPKTLQYCNYHLTIHTHIQQHNPTCKVMYPHTTHHWIRYYLTTTYMNTHSCSSAPTYISWHQPAAQCYWQQQLMSWIIIHQQFEHPTAASNNL